MDILILLFSAVFLGVALLFAQVSIFLTEKLKDWFNPTGKFTKYLTSFFGSGMIVWLCFWLGTNAVFAILTTYLNYTGGTPVIPPEALGLWVYFLALHILSFLVAGGIFDWRKLLPQTK